MCRNVLIYFNRELQDRVFRLFRDSLHPGGLAIVQIPETSEVSDMPRAAIAVVKSDYVLYLEKIGPLLRKLESKG